MHEKWTIPSHLYQYKYQIVDDHSGHAHLFHDRALKPRHGFVTFPVVSDNPLTFQT